MINNQLGTKVISDFMPGKDCQDGECFFIPDYQRGYRWKENQVQQLLNDLNEFEVEQNNPDVFYCLQPLVVKRDEKERWIVIDGQQRLTTLYIVLTCIEKMVFKETEPKYTIIYNNKPIMKEWLESIENTSEIDESDIDLYHMTNAYLVVKKWLMERNIKQVGPKIYDKILDYTRFIWYVVNEDIDPEIVFSNINMGRIKLTNAELIKALLLKKDNYNILLEGEKNDKNEQGRETENEMIASQTRISSAWDEMEKKLQKEEIWSFLTGSGDFKNYDTHIDLVFRIFAQRIINNNPEFFIENEEKLNSDTYTFIIFNRKLVKDKSDNNNEKYSNILDEFWTEIESVYNMLIDWFENREWYHLIGMLLENKKNQKVEYFLGLCDLYEKNTKDDFVDELKKRIVSEIDFKDNNTEEFVFTKDVVEEYLSSLEYKDSTRDKIRSIILLFNIISTQQNTDSEPRFPFSSYQKQQWDIEHIHSVTTDRPSDKSSREKWIKDVKEYLDEYLDNYLEDSSHSAFKSLQGKVNDIFNNEKYHNKYSEEFDIVFNQVVAFFAGEENVEATPINDISNLALLDSRINRGYKNAIFPIKRKEILNKNGDESFIPICTKNVFTKYYTERVKQMYIWSKNDRKDYFDKMVNTLFDYLVIMNKED